MEKILVIEDSILYKSLFKNRFKFELDFEFVFVNNLHEAKELLKTTVDFFACISEFKLPDAPNGEIIDLVVSKKIPLIIFTSIINKEIRNIVWAKAVYDYVLKIDPRNFEYILSLLDRLKKNPNIKILVVDNDLIFKNRIAKLLRIHKYKVYTASDGVKAKQIIDEHPDIRMVLTEFKIPKIDGFALTYAIRENYKKEDMAVIGITSSDDPILSTSFLKYGADDIIIKQSFVPEEFYRRITLNIENIEHFEIMKNAAFYDFLTGLYNRRYFFEFGQKLVDNAIRGNLNLTCAMMDLDQFKNVNDTYGHKAGDIVLGKIAGILKGRVRKADLVARIGGEEFCFLAVNMKKKHVYEIFDDLRKKIEKTHIEVGDGIKINVTISIGIFNIFLPTIDEMVKKADDLLYEAKKAGRNRIVMN